MQNITLVSTDTALLYIVMLHIVTMSVLLDMQAHCAPLYETVRVTAPTSWYRLGGSSKRPISVLVKHYTSTLIAPSYRINTPPVG